MFVLGFCRSVVNTQEFYISYNLNLMLADFSNLTA